jgi:hypothetical protein
MATGMPRARASGILTAVIASSVAVADTVTHAEPSENQINTVREIRAALRACLWGGSLAPAFIFSRSQTGIAPRPAHVFPERSRYLAGTFRPFQRAARLLPLRATPA